MAALHDVPFLFNFGVHVKSSLFSTLNSISWCLSIVRDPTMRLFAPRVPLRTPSPESNKKQGAPVSPNKMQLLSTTLITATTPSSSSRYKTRPSHSAPTPRNLNNRTPHTCSVVMNNSAPETVAHFPSVDWQSNYNRAQRSLNKLKLVRFQNWESSSRSRNTSDCLITQWIPSTSENH